MKMKMMKKRRAEQTKAKKIGIFRCVWVCDVWIWRKVHDHEANYLAKLGESLVLCVPMKWHCLNCAIAPQFCSDVVAVVVVIVVVDCVGLGLWAGLMSRINQRCHCLNLKSTFKQSTDTTEQRFRLETEPESQSKRAEPRQATATWKPNDQRQRLSYMLQICGDRFPLSRFFLSVSMSAPARGFNCPQLITNWPKRMPD